MTLFYIDVSHYDWDRFKGNLDWTTIKSSGIDIVFIRASYGDPNIYSPETRYFREMAMAAKKAGLKVGGYHNLINGDFESIKRQVTYFQQELNAVNADYAMVDIEPYQALRNNDLWPRLAAAELFAQQFKLTDSRKLAAYLPHWVWTNWLQRADLKPLMANAMGGLVSSDYSMGNINGSPIELYNLSNGDNGPGWVGYGNVEPTFWQFSSNARVPGASSVTDINAFKGTTEDFDSKMAWVLTKNMQAFRDQMNEFFPNRSKASDGTIGDTIHANSTSGHNPDDTIDHNAEWDSDSDTKSEVRAIDIDSDTGDPNVSMEDILQHLLRIARGPTYFPIRYMIYNKRIFRRTNGWVQEAYTGPSPHTEHIHLSGDYNDAADENYFNYRLDELVAITDADIEKIANAVKGADINSDPNSSYSLGGALWTMYGRTSVLNGWSQLVSAVAGIAEKVDLDPSEIQALKNALAVPTAEQNAAAVISALNGLDTDALVATLKSVLTTDQVAALKAAL